jgi:hypothetical protein
MPHCGICGCHERRGGSRLGRRSAVCVAATRGAEVAGWVPHCGMCGCHERCGGCRLRTPHCGMCGCRSGLSIPAEMTSQNDQSSPALNNFRAHPVCWVRAWLRRYGLSCGRLAVLSNDIRPATV